MATRRFLIADDHPLIREGLGLALRASIENVIVDCAGNIAEAVALVERHSDYRLVLLDFVLPDARGFSGFLTLQHMLNAVPIVIISATERPELVSAARALGAAGYVSKEQPLDQLVTTLKRVLEGRTAFSAASEGNDAAAQARDRLALLSGAQLRVLLALADGRLNKQIAGDLGVTEATIKAHLTAIFRKLRVNNRTQAILAMQPLLGATLPPPA
jgi:DNA-binding NarL/FixJ family response regulator